MLPVYIMYINVQKRPERIHTKILRVATLEETLTDVRVVTKRMSLLSSFFPRLNSPLSHG